MWRLLPLFLTTLLSFGSALLWPYPPGADTTLRAEERDVDEEVLRLRGEMLKMRMDYDSKLRRMEEKLQRLEDSRPVLSEAEGADNRPYIRTVAMAPEEKTKMEEELKALMGEKSQTTVPPSGTTMPPTLAYPPVAERAYPGGFPQRLRPGILQTYNPDMSVIGDFTGQFYDPGRGRGDYNWSENRYGKNREFADRFSLREIELGFQAAIDPYARADFFLGFHEEGVEVEEGYMTLLTLPWGLQAKIGQFKPTIGKVSRTHRPETFQVDYPLVIRNLFGEEGLRDPGVSVSWLVPNPWDKFIELTGEVLTTRGMNERYYVTHLKSFFDITPNSSFEAGLTGITGRHIKTDFEAGTSRFHANTVGLDLTYRWKPITYKANPYKSFLWQSETYFTHLDNIDFQRRDPNTDEVLRTNKEEDSWGAFTSAEYQLSRRNYVGLRLDYAQALHNHEDFELAVSPYWTFWQSDFGRWRLQYTHTQRRLDSVNPSPSSDDAIMLQTTFSIGAHRPHPF